VVAKVGRNKVANTPMECRPLAAVMANKGLGQSLMKLFPSKIPPQLAAGFFTGFSGNDYPLLNPIHSFQNLEGIKDNKKSEFCEDSDFFMVYSEVMLRHFYSFGVNIK
jgi:hypothetical protein